jgi:hypothetical protein
VELKIPRVKSYLLFKGYKTVYSDFENIQNSTSYVSNTVSGAIVDCGCDSSAGNAPIAKIKGSNLFSFSRS